jgi:hypothetical protein
MSITQFHPDIKVKEFIAKEQPGFRLRVRSWKCIAPKDLNSLEFIQESLDEDGVVRDTGTYNFFLTDDEAYTLAYALVNQTNPIRKLA